MIRSLYTSGWSMIADTKRIDVISNNLANANTNGYKKDLAINQSFEEMITKRINDYNYGFNNSNNIGNMKLGRDEGEIFTYFNQGNLINTGKNLNFAISNSENSFFNVGKIDGDGNLTEKYSRDGSFVLDVNGMITTSQGYFLLGDNGPITVEGDNIKVTKDGSIYENENLIDKIKITTFENKDNLFKIGNNLIDVKGDFNNVPFDGELIQGSLEESNVNTVDEMVEMINVLRSYEANQKLIQYEDNTLQKAVNEIGILR
ncbi:MAG: flagellar hook-basal body protein [Clostridiales bacterium]